MRADEFGSFHQLHLGGRMFGWLWRLLVGGAPQVHSPGYERMTDRGIEVMRLANEEAQHFNHEYIGTEHIRLEVEKIVQHGPGGEQVVMGRLPHTPHAMRVIEYSVEEARNLNHNYVGTEHLLLGLLREGEGVAAAVLTNLGLKLDEARKEVLILLGYSKQMAAEAIQQTWIEPPPPDLTAEQIRLLRAHFRKLEKRIRAAEAAQDVPRAARSRNEALALNQLLAWYERARGLR
jgi:hypothetical protein